MRFAICSMSSYKGRANKESTVRSLRPLAGHVLSSGRRAVILLVAQGGHGVEAAGAEGGDIAGGAGDEGGSCAGAMR